MKKIGAIAEDFQVLKRPIITEKASDGSASENARVKLVLKVSKDADKTRIAKAVERVFNTKVDSVNVVNVMGKPKRTKGFMGRRPSYKKAYITLKKGEKVQLVEGL
jgi:large subunit ribosomal protein L23